MYKGPVKNRQVNAQRSLRICCGGVDAIRQGILPAQGEACVGLAGEASMGHGHCGNWDICMMRAVIHMCTSSLSEHMELEGHASWV